MRTPLTPMACALLLLCAGMSHAASEPGPLATASKHVSTGAQQLARWIDDTTAPVAESQRSTAAASPAAAPAAKEPSHLALLAIGVAVIGVIIRRRHAADDA